MALFLALGLSVILVETTWAASVEWEVTKTLKLENAPLDVAVSADGKRTFVLSEKGILLIYSPGGLLLDTLTVGSTVDGIEVSPGGDQLFLSSAKDKTVQIVSLDYISSINIAGSPYKGAADAPVVVAVFSDFQ